MSNYSFNYSFNITGNCDVVVQGISQNVEKLNDNIRKSAGLWDSFEGKLLALNQFTQYVEGVGRTMQETLQPGAALNASLADLSAISGETGESLRRIEGYARETAKTFGGSAAQSIESYKLLLSQLSPELAKYPDALRAMGDNIAILSKTMGGDATAAAEVLTTAMNQYGVSLADPMEAARRMAEMMNVMAAAGKEGSAELPAIKVALEQCGMAAKGAGVSFEETNAAIQVLDKAGKKGAEGGVALRNVMMILSRGRFLPKETLKELQVAGVDVGLLTDKTRTLAERLEPLKVVLKDSALFSQLSAWRTATRRWLSCRVSTKSAATKEPSPGRTRPSSRPGSSWRATTNGSRVSVRGSTTLKSRCSTPRATGAFGSRSSSARSCRWHRSRRYSSGLVRVSPSSGR